MIDYICDRFKKNFSWIIVAIIVACLSFTIGKIKEIEYVVLIIASILLTAIGILFILFVIDFYKDYTKFRIYELVPKDIVARSQMYTVIFNQESLTTHQAIVKTSWELTNKMIDHTYDIFQVKIASNFFVPQFEEILIMKDNLELHVTRAQAKPSLTEEYLFSDPTKEHPVMMRKKFNIPLHIAPGDTTSFSVQYNSQAFLDAINGRDDYVEISIKRLTERLSFEIKLDGDPFIDQYMLTKPTNLDQNNRELNFKIFDESGERMELEEKRLERTKMMPKYGRSTIEWLVNNPIIGYRYSLYFSIKRGNPNLPGIF